MDNLTNSKKKEQYLERNHGSDKRFVHLYDTGKEKGLSLQPRLGNTNNAME